MGRSKYVNSAGLGGPLLKNLVPNHLLHTKIDLVKIEGGPGGLGSPTAPPTDLKTDKKCHGT